MLPIIISYATVLKLVRIILQLVANGSGNAQVQMCMRAHTRTHTHTMLKHLGVIHHFLKIYYSTYFDHLEMNGRHTLVKVNVLVT